MAFRTHVLAAYQASSEDFRAALESIGDDGSAFNHFRLGSSGPWQWANASVWQVGGSDIDSAIAELKVPAIRVTSVDGALWTLTVTAPGQTLFRGVHQFTQVGQTPEDNDESTGEDDEDDDFPDDELHEVAGINRYDPETAFLWDEAEAARVQQQDAEEAAAHVPALEDYVDYGAVLPNNVVEAMKQQSDEVAWHTAFLAHGRQIVDHLTNVGLPLDADALHRLLTIGPLTDSEEDSDIGNMPRFLKAIGIDGIFQGDDETRDDDEDFDEDSGDDGDDVSESGEVSDGSDHPEDELFKTFDPLMAECRLSPIDGDPVKVAQPSLLHLLSHLYCADPDVCVGVRFPNASQQPDAAWEDLEDVEVRSVDGQWHFCFAMSNTWYGAADPDELVTHELAETLRTLPDGSQVELTFAVEGLAERCHRYAGEIRGGQFVVNRVYPAVSGAVLTDALALAAEVCGSKPIKLRSTDEEEQVRSSYKRATGDVAPIINSKIKPDESRDTVVQTLLLKRFADHGPWDAAGAQRLIAADWDLYDSVVSPSDEESDVTEEPSELMQQMQAAIEKTQQANRVPHSDQLIFKGKTGRFLRASMSDLPHISSDDLRRHDSILAELGFRPVVDSVADVDQRQELTRCYAGSSLAISLLAHRHEGNQSGWSEVSDGAVLIDFSNGTVEFHTQFADGTSLITTSIDTATSKPHVGIYVRCYEDCSVEQMWARHLDGIARFKSHKATIPIDHLPLTDPEEFMKQIDDLFARFMTAGC